MPRPILLEGDTLSLLSVGTLWWWMKVEGETSIDCRAQLKLRSYYTHINCSAQILILLLRTLVLGLLARDNGFYRHCTAVCVSLSASVQLNPCALPLYDSAPCTVYIIIIIVNQRDGGLSDWDDDDHDIFFVFMVQFSITNDALFPTQFGSFLSKSDALY